MAGDNLKDILTQILIANQSGDVGNASLLGRNATINAAIEKMLLEQNIRRDAQFGIDRLTNQIQEDAVNQEARQRGLAKLIAEAQGVPSSEIIQRQPMEGEGTSPIFTNVVPEVIGRTSEGRPITTFGSNIVGRTGQRPIQSVPPGEQPATEPFTAGEEPISFEDSQALPQSNITAEQVMNSPEFADLILQVGQKDKEANAKFAELVFKMQNENAQKARQSVVTGVSNVLANMAKQGAKPEQLQTAAAEAERILTTISKGKSAPTEQATIDVPEDRRGEFTDGEIRTDKNSDKVFKYDAKQGKFIQLEQ